MYQFKNRERKEVWKGWNNPPAPYGRRLPCAHLFFIAN
jgi:hypothetical protein